MVNSKIRDFRSSLSVKNNGFESQTVVQEVTNDFGVGVGKWGVMSISLSHNREIEIPFDREIEIPFDCKQEGRESLFDCEEEEELKVVIKYKEKALSLWDNQFLCVNIERKSKVLHGYVKQLVETRDFGATEKIKEIIIGDSKLANVLEPLVKPLVEILDEKNFNESTKGSAACILAFVNFDKCGDDIKKKAIQALVKLMSDERDAISIPVLRTLTRLAYLSTDYARFIIENDAIEGACAVNVEPIFSSLKRIQNLAKFLVVVVRRVQLLDDKLLAVVSILNKILEIGKYNLRCIVRACYTLSFIEVKFWVTEENILNKIIDLLCNDSDMIASSAVRLAANIVKSSFREILTRNYKFLQYLAWSNIDSRPKKFQKEACDIILNIAADRGTSIKDLKYSGLMDTLVKLLKVDDFDVRRSARLAIRDVIRCHRTRDVTVF